MVPRNKAFARSLVWGHTTLVYYIVFFCKYMQCFVCRGCFTPPPTARVNIRTWEALEQPQMFTGILVRGFYLNSLSSSGLELKVQFVFLVVRFFFGQRWRPSSFEGCCTLVCTLDATAPSSRARDQALQKKNGSSGSLGLLFRLIVRRLKRADLTRSRSCARVTVMCLI